MYRLHYSPDTASLVLRMVLADLQLKHAMAQEARRKFFKF